MKITECYESKKKNGEKTQPSWEIIFKDLKGN